jgi:hypothetical protein
VLPALPVLKMLARQNQAVAVTPVCFPDPCNLHSQELLIKVMPKMQGLHLQAYQDNKE